jgi:DNA-binding NtrC family response regulator
MANPAAAISFSVMQPLHILLVDPDAERRQSTAAALRSANHVVLAVDDAALAAEALAAEPGHPAPPFDALMLDLALPGLDLAALRSALAPPAGAVPDTLEAAERRQIVLALAHTGGNRRDAARLLGVARSTLLNKIRRYELA